MGGSASKPTPVTVGPDPSYSGHKLQQQHLSQPMVQWALLIESIMIQANAKAQMEALRKCVTSARLVNAAVDLSFIAGCYGIGRQ